MAATVLITGCSAGGIGCALAYSFQAAGYHVFAAARKISNIDEALLALPQVDALSLDVTKTEDISQAVAKIRSHIDGKLNVLVNNAGVNYTSPVLDVDVDEGKKLFDVNFWGCLTMVQQFAPLLRKAHGTVVNITSIAGLLHTPFMGIYSASKAAMTILSETLRLELQPLGITVLTVIAGNVQTQFWENGTEIQLPQSSPYWPIRDSVAKAASGELGGKQDPREGFARQILEAVHSQLSGLVFRGAAAGSVRWAAKVIPAGMLDRLLSRGRGLEGLIPNK